MAKIEVIYLENIEEYREVFICKCGKKAYCLDPGDGIPTHLDENAITEFKEEE